MEFYVERGLCICSLHKYTRVARCQGGLGAKSMIDLVLVKKDMLRFVTDVKAVRGIGREI